ncbi:hypothetical protein [Corynebacterium gerontici]|uniref:hypothetical protein n=1 Tax=Corynebacterium gerontici TaxID=2079234 RepID=UPI000F4EB01E|nr:hypothetical protein [Corynebacterium gerontici]
MLQKIVQHFEQEKVAKGIDEQLETYQLSAEELDALSLCIEVNNRHNARMAHIWNTLHEKLDCQPCSIPSSNSWQSSSRTSMRRPGWTALSRM